MERILIVFLICLISGCQVEQSSEVNHKIAKDISNSSRYYESNLMSQIEKFVEVNHQNSNCSDEALETVYEMYSFLDSIQWKLEEISGGYDASGSLISSDETGFASILFLKSSLQDRLNDHVLVLKKLAALDETKKVDMLVSKIEKDIRIFDFPYYNQRILIMFLPFSFTMIYY